MAFPQTRMRRLRASAGLRGLVRETDLRAILRGGGSDDDLAEAIEAEDAEVGVGVTEELLLLLPLPLGVEAVEEEDEEEEGRTTTPG